MNLVKLTSGLLMLCITSCYRNKEHITHHNFYGMWRLDKIESIDNQSGTWAYDSTFAGWNGFILYDGSGHMGVQITPKGYKDFVVTRNTDSLNSEGLKKLVKFYQSNLVYFANYKIGNGINLWNNLPYISSSNVTIGIFKLSIN